MTTEENRFDPDSLKPFDKVLVRYEYDEQWIPQFFARWAYTERYYKYAECIGSEGREPHWNEVIPYNEDTKHLCYNYGNAPIYYNYWDSNPEE